MINVMKRTDNVPTRIELCPGYFHKRNVAYRTAIYNKVGDRR